MTLLSSDRDLLDAFRRGDRAALERVYEHYAPMIAAFLSRGFTFSSKGRQLQFRGYHQPFDLDNALQETFVRAFSERARLAYDGLNPYRSYVTTIARNLVLSEFRRREVAASQLFVVRDGDDPSSDLEARGAGPPLVSEPAPSAEAQLLRDELRRLYGAFVEQLSERERAYFVARFEERQIRVEAGRASGLSHMQARTLEKKLRRRFLAFMQDNGYLDTYAAGGKVAVTR